MNPNIEVIAPDLWAVNFQWVKEGWIKELRFVPDAKCNCEYACLKDDGTMVINKGSDFYPMLKSFMLKIMQRTDSELNDSVQNLNNKAVLDNYERFYLNVMEWEIKRRCVKQAYLLANPKPTLKEKIKKILRKVGEKYGFYQNSD